MIYDVYVKQGINYVIHVFKCSVHPRASIPWHAESFIQLPESMDLFYRKGFVIVQIRDIKSFNVVNAHAFQEWGDLCCCTMYTHL